MGAPKKYDRDVVLERARDVFWAKGYAAAGISELSAATGLNPSSLYNEFENKRGLYLAVLDAYGDAAAEEVLGRLARGRGLAAIERHLYERVDELEAGQWTQGCLLVNACAERAGMDADVAERTRRHIVAYENAFAQVLERAKARGTLRPSTSVQKLATFLASVPPSLVYAGKATRDAERLRSIVRGALAAIDRERA